MEQEQRIPVFKAVGLTYGLLRRFWWRATVRNIAAIALLIALYAAQIPLTGDYDPTDPYDLSGLLGDNLLLAMSLSIATIVPWTMLFVAFFRVGMVNAIEPNGWLGLRWGRRETCVLLRGVWLTIILILIALPIIFIASMLISPIFVRMWDPPITSLDGMLALVPTYILVGLPVGYFAMRWTPYAAAPAVDQSLKLGASWIATTGNGWRMLAISIMAWLPFLAYSALHAYAIFGLGVPIFSIWDFVSWALAIAWVLVSGFVTAVMYDYLVPKAAPATAETAPTAMPASDG